MSVRLVRALCPVALMLATAVAGQAAATIVIINGDAAGIGFNDPTAVAPVGGNTGTTLGQQRLNAFQHAANVWGATVTSVVTITVRSTWEALSCTSTAAVLGSAGATEVFTDFQGAPTPNRWYGKALADKLAGVNLDPTTADIRARFNINLGQSGCLTGTFFYLGLDNNHGTNVDLVSVLLHEFAHGLGFQTFTNPATGAYLASVPSVWDDFLLDRSTNKVWSGMSNAERTTSAVNTTNLVWSGAQVTAGAPSVLSAGTPLLTVTAPANRAAEYPVGLAAFGPALTDPGVSGEVMPVLDTAGNLGLACNPLSAANALAVNGKIALVDRGSCGFTVKAKNAQDAGAIAVIVGNNAAGSPPPGMGGSDPTITIPSVQIAQADANTLKAAMTTRTRTHSGLFATVGVNGTRLRGADAANRVMLYAPSPFQAGSSVSHYDVSATPNLLMEPAINGDLTHAVQPPNDLTLPLLKDIGWN